VRFVLGTKGREVNLMLHVPATHQLYR